MKGSCPLELLECDKVEVWPEGIRVFLREKIVVCCAGFPLLEEEITEADLEWARGKIAEIRSRGPIPQERALEMAEQAAELDDSEGLGKVKAVKEAT